MAAPGPLKLDLCCPRPDVHNYEGSFVVCLSCGSTSTSAPISPARRPREFRSLISDSLYKYSPLGEEDIRLLKIDPGEPCDTLVCNIFHSTLGADPFEAVSYTWADSTGDSGLTSVVTIYRGDDSNQSLQVKVTRNCEAALRRLRSRNEAKTVWIDAICINQEDISERGHQVHHMPRIYSTATQVLVYLGEAYDNSESVLDAIHKQQVNVSGLDRMIEMPSILPGIRSLLSRGWFNRVWVLQEIGLARKAVVLCGSYRVHWESFVLAAFDGRDNAWGYDGVCPPILRLPMNGQLPIKLFYRLLEDARSCRSTDPRDKVFALFGLLNNCQDEGLDADYTKTNKAVFTETAEFLINKYKTLDILFAVEPRTKFFGALPSWAPDWNVSLSVRFANEGVTTHHDALLIPADFTWLEDAPVNHETSGVARVRLLNTKGYRLGTVVSMTAESTMYIHEGLPSDASSPLKYGCKPKEWKRLKFKRWIKTLAPEKPICIQNIISLFQYNFVNDNSIDMLAQTWDDLNLWFTLIEGLDRFWSGKSARSTIRRWILESASGLSPNGTAFRLFITAGGHVGLGPASLQIGDVLCRLRNTSSPCFLRRDTNGYYIYVGHCLGGVWSKDIAEYENGKVPLILHPDLYHQGGYVDALGPNHHRVLTMLNTEPEENFGIL
jgi:hypothetical protein